MTLKSAHGLWQYCMRTVNIRFLRLLTVSAHSSIHGPTWYSHRLASSCWVSVIFRPHGRRTR